MKTERQFSSQASRRADFPVMLFLAGVLGFAAARAEASGGLPPASEVTRRMIERAKAVAEAEEAPQYAYQKRSIFERMDAAGSVTKRVEKLYEVRLINGFPFNRLIQIQGRDLTPEELKKEEQREEQFHRQFVHADRKKLLAQKKALVTPELIARYEFEVKKRVVLSNRPTLVVTFKPRPGDLPAKTIQDELLNRMAGTLWIDEADADTARLEVNMVQPFSLGWLGWLGSLNACELRLERQRMPDGVWVNKKMSLLIQCRKLVKALRFRTTEESSGFKRVEQ